jgi:hypothetical protein
LGVDAHLLGIDPTNPEHLREGANFTLMTVAGEVDVWTDAAELRGAAPWPEMRAPSRRRSRESGSASAAATTSSA